MPAKDRESWQSFLCRLEDTANAASVRIALSSSFSDITDRHYYRLQAEDLLALGTSQKSRGTERFRASRGNSGSDGTRIARRNAGTVSCAENYFQDLLLYAALQRIGREPLLLYEICLLRTYDRKNQTEYYETLFQFLRHGGHISKAAQDLHVDQKTLRYRMQKICRLIHRTPKSLIQDETLLLGAAIEHIRLPAGDT